MRRLIVSNITSLDGYYVAGPNWPFEIMDEAFDAYNAERLRAADTWLLGRTSYDGFKDFWPHAAENADLRAALPPARFDIVREIARLNNPMDKVVISDSLTAEQTGPWHDSTRIIRRADAHEQIAALKRQDGNEIVVFGSRTLWNDLLAHDLVDELHLMIGPIVLGAGTPMFDGPPAVSPRLIDTRTWNGSGNVLLRYDVRRQGT